VIRQSGSGGANPPALLAHSWDGLQHTTSVHTMTESATPTKYLDAQSMMVHGRIANLEEVEYNGQTFLSAAMYTTISEQTDARVVFTNSNGMLTAFRNGNLVVGQEMTLIGRLKGVRAFYTDKEDQLQPLKNPELQMSVQQYIFGSKPQPKKEPVQAQPTLEEIPF